MSVLQNEPIIDLISLIEQRAPVRLARKASTDGVVVLAGCQLPQSWQE